MNELVCQICGDAVGLNQDNELFVACNECAFPVCRTCYEYERKEGNGVCPHCKTRYKRLKGEIYLALCPSSGSPVRIETSQTGIAENAHKIPSEVIKVERCLCFYLGIDQEGFH